MTGIADTGFVVAFARQADEHHVWARAVARQIPGPYLSCDAVLAEATFHLGSAAYVLDLVEAGFLAPAFAVVEHRSRLQRLALQFADRKPDLADLCLICLSELHPRRVIVTTDRRGFTVYRRFQRDALPLLLPPA